MEHPVHDDDDVVVAGTTSSSQFPEGLSPGALQDPLQRQQQRDPTVLVWDFTSRSSFAHTTHTDVQEDSGRTTSTTCGHVQDASWNVKIYLRTPQEEGPKDDTDANKNGAGKVPSSDTCTATGPSNSNPLPHNNNSDDNDHNNVIEASMLQYQRQLRKTQAAKKAGATLTQDQLEIVHQDDHIVVVHKPAGVLCVPGIHNNDSIANLLFDRLQSEQGSTTADDTETLLCPDACSMAVHRLDMDTSGLVVFGKTKSAVSTLHQVFRRETPNNSAKKNKRGKKKKKKNGNQPLPNNHPTSVTKEYEALVCGHLPLHIYGGHIDLPLQRDVHHPPFMRVSTPLSESIARQVVDALRQRNWTKLTKRNPKPSQTIFRVMSREYVSCDGNDDNQSIRLPVTRLSLTPITGRTHQLRVHCAAMGFPIVGDPVYGLYGESAFAGGLHHNPVEIVASNGEGKQQQDDGVTTDTADGGWRALVSLQKQLLEVYPPNEKDMCLHAKRLGFPHPTTGEILEWQVPPKF